MPGDATGSSGRQRDESFRRLNSFTFALLVLGHAGFSALFSLFGSRFSEYAPAGAYVAFGVIGVQPILFAMWAALGPQSSFKRFLWAAGACVLVTYAHLIPPFGRVAGSFSFDPFLIMPFITSGFFIATVLALLVPRRVFSWRIEHPRNRAETPKVSASKVSQFSLKYLLGWIAGAAVLLALGRFIADERATTEASNTLPLTAAQFAAFLGFFFVVLLPTVGVPWMTLAYGRQARWFVVAALVAWGGLTWAAVSVLTALTRASPSEVLGTVVLIQFGAATAGFTTAVVLRFRGFRLQRIVNQK